VAAAVSKAMKRVLIFLTFALVLSLTACSYTSSFVVINGTEQPIEVRYKVKGSLSDPFQMVGEPAKTTEVNLRNSDKEWQPLSPEQYSLDREARTITVQVMPHEALRVGRITNYRGHGDSSPATTFIIEEINLKGVSGDVRLQGNQARRGFIEESANLYTLTYR
jgi:hypothetical protein